jgi:capsular exopolysaccharide synthesis family protein
VERAQNTRLLKINAYWHKGVLAADIANAAAEVFIEQSLQDKFEASKRSISWLTEQILATRQKIEESERGVVAYQKQEKLISQTEATDFQQGEIHEIQDQYLESQRTDREILAKRKKIQDLLKKERIHFVPMGLSASLDSLGETLTKAELEVEKAKLEYKEKHPRVIRLQGEVHVIEDQIRSELGKVIEGLDSEHQVNRARREILDDSLEVANQSALAGNEKLLQMAMLNRETETYKELYGILIKKLKAMDLGKDIGESNIRIVEYAKAPSAPIRPRKQRNLFYGIVVGFTISLAFAFVLEYYDRTIRTPDDLEQALDYPILASIPRVKAKDPGGSVAPRTLLSQNHQQSAEMSAFQALRTALRFCHAGGAPFTYLVTSTSPSEGKTTVSVNLGLSIALSGSRVLVVDTDLRRPKIHTAFQRPNDRGVTNIDPERVLDFVQKTDQPNLEILTSGPHVHKVFELLESLPIRQAFANLKQHYDYIIFDSPPVGSVVDASVLATYVDGVIFVLRSGRIESLHVKHAKEQLEKVQARVFGVVLNNLDPQSTKYFYNYYYYYRGYYGDRANEIFQGIKDSVQKL